MFQVFCIYDAKISKYLFTFLKFMDVLLYLLHHMVSIGGVLTYFPVEC